MSVNQMSEKTNQSSMHSVRKMFMVFGLVFISNGAQTQTLDKKSEFQLKKTENCATDNVVEKRKLDAQDCRQRLNISETDMTKVDAKLADKFGECMVEKMSTSCSK